MKAPWKTASGGMTGLLRALSVPYGAAVRLRRALYGSGVLGVRSARAPVISVGGITVGGSGKTPTVVWMTEVVHELGLKPAVVSRGYGGDPGDQPFVVSRGNGEVSADVRRCGDEPILIARRAPETIVVAHPDRVRACEVAVDHGAELILLDDGLQHKRLLRDLDVVLLDAREPFGNEKLLPAGPLRDAPTAIGSASLVLLTRAERATETQIAATADRTRALAPQALIAEARYRMEPPEPVDGRRIFYFCGIARPETFEDGLREQGAEVVGRAIFEDHHAFSPEDLRDVTRAAKRKKADVILTTEKDAVRFEPEAIEAGVVALTLDVDATARRYLEERIRCWFQI